MSKGLSLPQSRIRTEDVSANEKWIGHFLAPSMIFMAYTCLSGTYLNQFYVDVLRMGSLAGGMFLVLLPIVSKLLNVLTNIVTGQLIEKTRSRQGKARPWILLCAPLLAITGAMLYLVPRASMTVQAIFVGISYNLFFSVVFTMYNVSQSLLVPLSTDKTQQRDSLALFSSMGQSMLPGTLVFVAFPMFILPLLQVSRERWALAMSIISAIMVPGVLLQYFFTKERVTAASEQKSSVRIGRQIKACLTNKSWVIYFAMLTLFTFAQNFSDNAMIFYSNWVLGTYNDGITLTLLNVIGEAPLGFGVFLLWPVAKRFGKRKTMLGGMVLASAACAPILLMPRSMPAVLISLAAKSFGMLPSFLFSAMMAEAMDSVEHKKGFRCDGFTATVNSVIITLMAGAATGLFNLGLSVCGYVPPSASGEIAAQNVQVESFLIAGFAAVPAVCCAVIAVLMILLRHKNTQPVA